MGQLQDDHGGAPCQARLGTSGGGRVSLLTAFLASIVLVPGALFLLIWIVTVQYEHSLPWSAADAADLRAFVAARVPTGTGFSAATAALRDGKLWVSFAIPHHYDAYEVCTTDGSFNPYFVALHATPGFTPAILEPLLTPMPDGRPATPAPGGNPTSACGWPSAYAVLTTWPLPRTGTVVFLQFTADSDNTADTVAALCFDPAGRFVRLDTKYLPPLTSI